MKRIIICLIAITPFMGLWSCENKLIPYNDPQNRLNFSLEKNENKIAPVRYTFVYDIEGKLIQDTVWLKIETMGFVADTDRVIQLIQLDTVDNAVAGVHYVGFDDPVYDKYYKIAAGKTRTTIPIIMKRDASLKTEIKNLFITFGQNENFSVGYADRSRRLVQITDQPVKPSSWNSFVGYYFAGYYGQRKHQFMIDVLRPLGATADEAFFYNIIPSPANVDTGLTDYWYGFFNEALTIENERRAKEKLEPLKEANGKLVEFNNKNNLPEWVD